MLLQRPAESLQALPEQISQAWQLAVLGAAIAWLVVRRHGVVSVLVLAGLLGVAAALTGLPPSR